MEVITKYEPNTVGYLLEFIKQNNIPNEAIVYYQRIEDAYFEKHNWKTLKKEGFFYHQAIERNKKVDGEFKDKTKYPLIEDPEVFRASDEDLEQMKEEYIKSFCPVKYKDDDNLFIDAHY